MKMCKEHLLNLTNTLKNALNENLTPDYLSQPYRVFATHHIHDENRHLIKLVTPDTYASIGIRFENFEEFTLKVRREGVVKEIEQESFKSYKRVVNGQEVFYNHHTQASFLNLTGVSLKVGEKYIEITFNDIETGDNVVAMFGKGCEDSQIYMIKGFPQIKADYENSFVVCLDTSIQPYEKGTQDWKQWQDGLNRPCCRGW